jgi:hypothetical protein
MSVGPARLVDTFWGGPARDQRADAHDEQRAHRAPRRIDCHCWLCRCWTADFDRISADRLSMFLSLVGGCSQLAQSGNCGSRPWTLQLGGFRSFAAPSLGLRPRRRGPVCSDRRRPAASQCPPHARRRTLEPVRRLFGRRCWRERLDKATRAERHPTETRGASRRAR